MAKRFIDTQIWRKNWFRKLTPTHKLFIIYLFTNCDHAGLFDVDIEAAEFYIGGKIDIDEIPDGWIIKVGKDRWFLPKFIEFQYPKGFNSKMKMHQSILNILEKYNLNKYISTYTTHTPNSRGILPLLDKDMDKEKNKIKVIGKAENNKIQLITDLVFKELLNDIMKYFGFSSDENNDKNAEIEQLLISLRNVNKIEYFHKQYIAYKKYKTQSKERTHGFRSFIGRPQDNYLDGAWNQNNWVKKLSGIKQSGGQNFKITEDITNYKYK